MASQIAGIDFNELTVATATPRFRLGTVGGFDDPNLGYREFVYGRANGAVTGAGFVCLEQVGFDFVMANSTNASAGASGHGTRVGAAQVALADNECGWFQVYGRGSVRTLASAAIGTRLNTTATGGALDDDGTVGAEVINGIVIQVASGGAPETNPSAVFSYPTVGVTL